MCSSMKEALPPMDIFFTLFLHNPPAFASIKSSKNVLRLCSVSCPASFLFHFKNKQKNVWSNVFWYVKVCTFWKCIQYTIHWDKTQMLKKIPFDKINGTKNALIFFSELQLITVLPLIFESYASWSTRFVSKTVCGFSIFDYIFL